MTKFKFNEYPLTEQQKLMLDVVTIELAAKVIDVKYMQRVKDTKFGDTAMKNSSFNIAKYAKTLIQTVAVYIGFDTPDFSDEVNFERVPLIAEIFDKLVCLPPSELEKLNDQLNNVEFESPVNKD